MGSKINISAVCCSLEHNELHMDYMPNDQTHLSLQILPSVALAGGLSAFFDIQKCVKASNFLLRLSTHCLKYDPGSFSSGFDRICRTSSKS